MRDAVGEHGGRQLYVASKRIRLSLLTVPNSDETRYLPTRRHLTLGPKSARSFIKQSGRQAAQALSQAHRPLTRRSRLHLPPRPPLRHQSRPRHPHQGADDQPDRQKFQGEMIVTDMPSYDYQPECLAVPVALARHASPLVAFSGGTPHRQTQSQQHFMMTSSHTEPQHNDAMTAARTS